MMARSKRCFLQAYWRRHEGNRVSRLAARVARSDAFEPLTLLVVGLNVVSGKIARGRVCTANRCCPLLEAPE